MWLWRRVSMLDLNLNHSVATTGVYSPEHKEHLLSQFETELTALASQVAADIKENNMVNILKRTKSAQRRIDAIENAIANGKIAKAYNKVMKFDNDSRLYHGILAHAMKKYIYTLKLNYDNGEFTSKKLKKAMLMMIYIHRIDSTLKIDFSENEVE